MKLSRFSILAVAALTCAAFAVSCESDDPRNAIAPFWTDGDVDGDGSGLNGGRGNGFGDGSGLNGGDNGFGTDGPGAFGEDLGKTPYIDGFGARIEGVEFQPVYFPYDQNTISSTEEAKVSAVAQYLLGHPEAGVVVEG